MPEELKEENTLTENVEGFRLVRVDDQTKSVDIYSKKDENGDYPAMFFELTGDNGELVRFALKKEEMSAITFALTKADDQYKLLNAKFREYKEVPVRLIIEAKKDIKKGDFVVAWRKERVPIDFNYSKT
jgi:hypothetical protein